MSVSECVGVVPRACVTELTFLIDGFMYSFVVVFVPTELTAMHTRQQGGHEHWRNH